MRVELTVPAGPEGSTPLLCVPACAGVLRIGNEEFAPSWTERRLPVDAAPGEVLVIEVDEAEKDPFGGFLPAIEVPPRGLWQGSWWEFVRRAAWARRPSVRWADGRLVVRGELLHEPGAAVQLRVDGIEAEAWGESVWAVPYAEPEGWRPAELGVSEEGLSEAGPPETSTARPLPTVQLELLVDGEVVHAESQPIAHVEVRAEGEQLLVGGEVFRVQGLLHWGYYPDLLGPDPSPEALREEIAGMQARGFNLLKACLWLPPHRFLDVCDEMGMAVWVEYPRWAHPVEGDVAAYRDFIEHDAAHPCVVLRTLSCENDHIDPRAVDRVLEWVFDAVPDALINDHSAWLDCNHRPMFWDEHPYLHAAQWPWYLERLQRALLDRPRLPLILGETMAFDALEDEWSREAAVRLRRRQIEQLRAVFPDAGYVVCAARDIPQSPLGLQDLEGAWKTPVESWAWQVEAAAGASEAAGAGEEAGAGAALPWEAARGDGEPLELPAGVHALDDLGAAADSAASDSLADLPESAVLFHHAAPRRGAWRCPEHTFWCPVATFDAVMPAELDDLCDELFETLLAGRGLLPPPAEQARVLIAARDVHDRSGGESRQPFVFVARLVPACGGPARPLLVSSLRIDHAAGRAFPAELLRRFAADPEAWLRTPEGAPLPPLPALPQQDRLLLDGPWQLTGAGVRGGAQTIQPGTMLCNEGANAVQGWVEASAAVTPPAAWSGPLWLRAEAVGDGFELWIDGQHVHTHGRPGFTWDAGRDVPCEIELTEHLRPGHASQWRIVSKDHRGAGALIGPLALLRAPDKAWIY